MLDVHILIHPETPQAWVRECLASVRVAAQESGFPVAVHTLPAVIGHIGRARAAGYALGAYPYVTSVDDDDWVEPNAFAVLADVLRVGVTHALTGCEMHQNGKSQGRDATRDNLRVFRRDIAESAPLEDWPVWDGPMMLAHARAKAPAHRVDAVVYHQRLHMSPHRKLIATINDAMRARIRALTRDW